MAERTILGIGILLSLYQTYAALDVFAPSPQRALFTTDTILICTFSVDKQPPDLNFLVVSWIFQGRVILKYDRKSFSTQDPRMSLSVESLEYGYASLYVSNVNISDRGTYKCIVKYSTESKEKEISFKVFARPLLSIQSTKIQRNTENTLTCKVTGFFPSDILITWYRNGEVLRNLFMGKPQMYNNGTYHVDSNMTITPTNDDQNQTFSCSVLHESLQEPLQKDFQLVFEDIETSSNVVTVICIFLVLMTLLAVGIFLWRRKYRKKAKPQLVQPVSSSLMVSEALKYLVTLENFYPRDITIRWTHGVEETQQALPSTENFTEIPDGTYGVCSEVIIPEELLKDPEFRVRLSWEHESLDTPGYKDLSIRDSEYIWIPVVEEIQTPNVFHDTPVTLHCHISEYFPDAITVTWLRKSRDQELCEETDMVSKTKTPRRETDNTYSCTASLTIIPTLSVHQGAEYICRVDHPSLERTIERKTGKLIVKAKPQMEEPIMITMGDSSHVLFTLNLMKFYPKNIDIEWTYESKDEKFKMQYNNNFIKCEDLTHDVSSVGSFPMYVFNDLQTKVSVTWKHEYMDEPETRTLTIRDLPWRPQVGEILIPKLEEDKKACLTCDISGYFPDHLKVSWFKKEPKTDSPTNVTELPKDNYKVYDQKEQKDKTFSNKSSLTFTPSFRRDQGSEFICRVEHPSLEKPIEKTTGPLRIDLPRPQVGEIKIPKLEEDKKATLTCDISGNFPDYTTVSWYRKLIGADLHPIITPLTNDDFQICSEKKKDNKIKSSLAFTTSFCRDQGSEFICRVEHPSLEEPIERRTGPLRIDLPRPQIGKINIPKLEEDKEATLTCDISGYFPHYTTVSWYRKPPGTDLHPIITPLPNDDFQVCTEIKDKTCQLSLTFTPSFSRDQGSEFICTVTNPSLEEPIEKTTGPLKLSKHSMNGTVKGQQKASS